jgi:hypothetical protein
MAPGSRRVPAAAAAQALDKEADTVMYRKEDRERLRLIEAKVSGFERSLQNGMKALMEILAKGQENQAEYLRRIENHMVQLRQTELQRIEQGQNVIKSDLDALSVILETQEKTRDTRHLTTCKELVTHRNKLDERAAAIVATVDNMAQRLEEAVERDVVPFEPVERRWPRPKKRVKRVRR